MIFRVVVAAVMLTLMGYGVLRALTGRHSSRSLSRHALVGLAFGAGLGLQSLGLFYLSYLAIPVNTLNSFLLFCGLFTCGWAGTILQRLGQAGDSGNVNVSRAVEANEQWNRAQIGLTGVIAIAVLLVFIDACGQPLLSFDARATWAYKAKVLYHEGGIYGDAFFDPDRLHAKARYPQLVPQAEMFLALCAGRFEERALKVVFPLYFLSLILLLYFQLRTRLSRTPALWALALFSTLPGLLVFANGGAASGYADVPLAFNLAAFVMALSRWLWTQSSRMLFAAGLFGVLTLFTKLEGVPLVLISLGVTGTVALFILPLRFRTALMFFALLSGMGLALLPWFRFQAKLPILDEDLFHRFTFSKLVSGSVRIPEVVLAFAKELFLKPHLWSFLGFFLLVAIVRRRKNTFVSTDIIFITIPLLYALLLCSVFLVTPWQVDVLLPLTASRLMMHTLPLLFLWVAWQLNPQPQVTGEADLCQSVSGRPGSSRMKNGVRC